MAKYRGGNEFVHPNSRFKTSQIFRCLASERYDVIRITRFDSTQLVTCKWVMDDNDALKVTFFFWLTSFLVCHASFSLLELSWTISKDQDRQGCRLVFVGHGYGGFVLQQALVKLHDQSGSYKDLQSNLCGIVFYGGTNTKFTIIKHHLMLMRNKSWSWSLINFQSILDSLMSKSLKDLKGPLLELSEHFKAALDLKKVKVCVVSKNKSFLQVCIFYPYSN